MIQFLDVLEQEGHNVVINNGEDGTVHLGPCVTCHARLASVSASAEDERELGEARYLELIEYVFQSLCESLVI